jgi:hypothetical protein
MNKYGLDNFSLIILEICESDRDICLMSEQLAFEVYKPRAAGADLSPWERG